MINGLVVHIVVNDLIQNKIAKFIFESMLERDHFNVNIVQKNLKIQEQE